jgi:hypothetical protein
MEGNNGPVFAWVELVPAEEGKLEPATFRVFQIDVKSDTAIGHQLHDDPLSVLRDQLPPDADIDAETREQVRELAAEMEIDEDARAQVLRVNAERPSNPRKRKEVWTVYPDNTTAVGVQYKYLK